MKQCVTEKVEIMNSSFKKTRPIPYIKVLSQR